METKEIYSNRVITKLNISITESLKSGFLVTYVFDVSWKRFYAITKDWQYSFIWKKTWNKIDILQETQIFSQYNEKEEMTFDDILEEYWFTEYCLHVNNMWWWNWFIIESNQLRSFSMENMEEIDNFFIVIEQNKTKWNINNILNNI